MAKPLDDWSRVWVFGLLVFTVGGFAAAQDEPPDYYGTASTNYHYVSAEEFELAYGPGYYHVGDGFWGAAGGLVFARAPLRLPSGALVDGYTVVHDDSNPSAYLSLQLQRCWVGAFGSTGTFIISFFQSSIAPGVTSTWVDLDPDHTISYYNTVTLSTQSYVFELELPVGVDLSLRGVIVRWKRQISPAPGTATFPDVAPGFWAFQEIEALAASEITTGFPDGTFRPTAPVTRAQMATFLARALGLHWVP